MAVESRFVPSMPTPTIPKRTRSLGAVGRAADAYKGLESRKTVRAATVAPAARAVVCKNSRREKRILFIKWALLWRRLQFSANWRCSDPIHHPLQCVSALFECQSSLMEGLVPPMPKAGAYRDKSHSWL